MFGLFFCWKVLEIAGDGQISTVNIRMKIEELSNIAFTLLE